MKKPQLALGNWSDIVGSALAMMRDNPPAEVEAALAIMRGIRPEALDWLRNQLNKEKP
jgi:hypothetical protein